MSEQNKFDSTYSAVVSMAEQMVGEGKYDSTYSAVLAIYQNLTSDMDTKFDSVYSIVVKIADGIESGEIDPSGGGGSDEPINYNTHKFYNMYGGLVEEWTLEETQSKTELPTLDDANAGDHMILFDGWNWDLEQLKSASCGQNIGAMYRPSDGKTRIVIEIDEDDTNLYQLLGVSTNDSAIINWGDGVEESLSLFPNHTYSEPGTYVISIDGSVSFRFGDSSLGQIQWNGMPYWYYNSRIKRIFCGNNVSTLDFGYCTGIDKVVFTGDTVSVTSTTFTETKSLKYLVIPKGVISYPTTGKSIGVISMPYGVTNIGNQFKGCSSLKSMNIPDSVTSIGYSAFQNCSSLQSVNIPNSVTSMSGSVFYGCSSLQSINIPVGVTNINDDVFNKCFSLQSINIPDGVTSISSKAFQDCSSLQSVNIPNSVTSIGSYIFQDCVSLQSINIPDGVTSISYNAFSGCYSLQSINIPDSVTNINYGAFGSCYSLQSINIPDGVTSIGDYAFSGCYSLQSINIPDVVTSIGSGVFRYCYSLQSINIPNGVTNIATNAFAGCQYITVDFSQNTQVPTLSSTNAFETTAVILVPSALYDEWIATTNWSSLSSQIKAV